MDAEQRQQGQADEVGRDRRLAGVHAHLPRAAALGGVVGLVGSLLALQRLGDLRAEPRAAVVLMLAAGAAHALACAGAFGIWRRGDARTRRVLVLVTLGLSVSIRIIAFGLPPTLSDDVYRYRWDGRVQSAGVNPYRYAPAASELAPLRDADWERINYPRIRTIYPPLSQILFAATYRISDTIAGFRLVAMVGDLLVVALILLCLRAFGAPSWLLSLYALHPLPAIEFASSGHFDAWVMAAVLAAVWAHRTGRATVSTLALGAGILLKAWPLVLAPFLLRPRPRRHVALLGITVLAGALPYLDAGAAMLHPWMEYAGRWRFNDGAFHLLAALTGSLEAAKAAAAGIGLGLLAWLWRRGGPPLAGGYWVLLAFILLMPTVHPWYLLWALPLAALAADLAWVALCSLAPAAYWILVEAGGDSNVWVEPGWPRLLEYVPTAIAWLCLAWRVGAPYPGRTPPWIGLPERGDRGK